MPPYVTSPPSRSIAPPFAERRFRFEPPVVGRNDEAHSAGEPARSGSSPTIVLPLNAASDVEDSSKSLFAPTDRLPPVTAIPPETLLKSSAAIDALDVASAAACAAFAFAVASAAAVAIAFTTAVELAEISAAFVATDVCSAAISVDAVDDDALRDDTVVFRVTISAAFDATSVFSVAIEAACAV